MSATKKITKKEQYNVLLDIITLAEDNGFEVSSEITYEDLRNFVNHEIELLDSKAAAAQKRAAAKKQEGDALREDVLNVLSETEFMTIDQIVEKVREATGKTETQITRNMVTSRLTQLGEKGTNQVEREQISIGGEGAKGRKASAYRRKA